MTEKLVAEFSSEIEAEMTRELLKSRGIMSFILKDDAGNMLPSLEQTEGVKLIVAEEDEKAAKAILRETQSGQ